MCTTLAARIQHWALHWWLSGRWRPAPLWRFLAETAAWCAWRYRRYELATLRALGWGLYWALRGMASALGLLIMLVIPKARPRG